MAGYLNKAKRMKVLIFFGILIGTLLGATAIFFVVAIIIEAIRKP